MEENNQTTSHKREKIRGYPLQFKLDLQFNLFFRTDP